MLIFVFNPSLLFLPVFAGEISLCHVFFFFFFFLTVFWPLHGEQCCTFYTIHISMMLAAWSAVTAFFHSQKGKVPAILGVVQEASGQT